MQKRQRSIKLYLTSLITGVCLLGTITSGTSQISNLTWTGFDLRVPIDSKSSLSLKPIIRHNLDGDGYQNLSLDISYKRSFDRGYFAQILGRTWYMPMARYRQFLWLDIGKSWQIDKVKLTQKFRLHGALDIDDNFDGDFIRSFTQVAVPITDNIKLSLNLEPWLSLNNKIEISRYRIEPGLIYTLADQWTLGAVYRYQSDFVIEPNVNQNHIVTTLIYTLQRGE